MSLSEQNLNAVSGGARDFRTTHWSLVVKAGRADNADAAAALDKLCRAYWYPLYAFVRRRGHDPETARDLTQSFFAALLARNQFAVADPARGRFRSFLVHSLTHFLANEWRDAQRLKRGGGAVVFSLDGLEPEERYRLEPAVENDAEKLFERRWAYTLVEGALERLRAEHERAGKGRLFGELAVFLPGGEPVGTMADTAQRLGMSESALKVAVHRLRQRFRAVFREEVAIKENQIDSARHNTAGRTLQQWRRCDSAILWRHAGRNLGKAPSSTVPGPFFWTAVSSLG